MSFGLLAIAVVAVGVVVAEPLRDATVGPPTFTIARLDALADQGRLPSSATIEPDSVVDTGTPWTYTGRKGNITGHGSVVRLVQGDRDLIALVDTDEVRDREFSGAVQTELRDNVDDGGEFTGSDRPYVLETEQLFRNAVVVWIGAAFVLVALLAVGRRSWQLRSRGKRSFAARLEAAGGIEPGLAAIDGELAAAHRTIAAEDGKAKREPVHITEHWLVRRRGASTVVVPLDAIDDVKVTKGRYKGAWWWQVVVRSTFGSDAIRFAHRRDAADECAASIRDAAGLPASPA